MRTVDDADASTTDISPIALPQRNRGVHLHVVGTK
jgi:hypothetical protein